MTSPSPLLQEGSWLVLFPSARAGLVSSAPSSNFSSPYRGSKEGVTFLLQEEAG